MSSKVMAAVLGVSTLAFQGARAQGAAESDSVNVSAWSIALAVELRERFESSRNPVFGLAAPARNDYLLHRAAVLADIHDDDRFRTLVELVGGFTSGWAGPRPPTQDDPLDLLQGFAALSLPLSGGEVTIQAGRQQMSFGSSRLVSVREATNVRRAFDGIRSTWISAAHTTIDAFIVRPVFPEDDVFDDRSSSEQNFWGVYGTLAPPAFGSSRLDAYYLGLRRDDAAFAQGEARELRHTVGLRLFGDVSRWDWNIEAAWQWGSFGASRIRAWTVSVDVGYGFPAWPFSPRLGVKADAISGDGDLQDATLGTFNPLFPKLPYFSEANVATPANLLDVQPGVVLSLTDQLSCTVSWNALWKYAREDAFYSPPLVAVSGTSMSKRRDIGWQLNTALEWQPVEHLALGATYVTFEPRSVTEHAGGQAGSFFTAWVQWTF